MAIILYGQKGKTFNTDMNLPAFLLKLVLKQQNFLIKY